MSFELLTDKKEIVIRVPELENRIRYEEHSFAFLLNGSLIAMGEVAFEEDNSIEIKMLETIEKKKGYGRMFVEYLKTIPGIVELWGESVPDAVPFWQKVGVQFEPTGFQQFIEADEHEEGFLIPFTIKL